MNDMASIRKMRPLSPWGSRTGDVGTELVATDDSEVDLVFFGGKTEV